MSDIKLRTDAQNSLGKDIYHCGGRQRGLSATTSGGGCVVITSGGGCIFEGAK
jgi:hypothetical protein